MLYLFKFWVKTIYCAFKLVICEASGRLWPSMLRDWQFNMSKKKKKMDELSVYPTKKNPPRQRRSSLSGLEGDKKKECPFVFWWFLVGKKKKKKHNANEAEKPAGRWRTGETGSGEGAAAGDVMSCYRLADSRRCHLLRHTPGWGAALMWSSLCEVSMGCCWCTFVHLKDKNRETNVIMGGHEQQCDVSVSVGPSNKCSKVCVQGRLWAPG